MRDASRHAAERVRQRFGVTLTPTMARKIIQSIDGNRAALLRRQGEKTSVWVVRGVLPQPAQVVYAREGAGGRIVTVMNLPKGWT